jgi:hypothetical protein
MGVPIEDFGRDHWSTFAYIETRVVDYRGVPDKRHLRCNHARHPLFAHEGGDAAKYPTRMKLNKQLFEHDDWDCLDDLEDVGLIENVGSGVNRVYALTDLGRSAGSLLRAHKGQGGKYDDFVFAVQLPRVSFGSSAR